MIKKVAPGILSDDGHLFADVTELESCHQFIIKIRQAADDAELKAQHETPYKARLLRQNARAARKDADSIESTMPYVSNSQFE